MRLPNTAMDTKTVENEKCQRNIGWIVQMNITNTAAVSRYGVTTDA